MEGNGNVLIMMIIYEWIEMKWKINDVDVMEELMVAALLMLHVFCCSVMDDLWTAAKET